MRTEQLARLSSLELQAGDGFGEAAWMLAHELWRQLPDGVRIDLPSAHVFCRILGLLRTGATLKTGKLLRLELSAEEIGTLIHYSKTTVEAALRWLGSGPIEYAGQQVSRGIGLINRGRRTAWGYLEGKLRRIYRTSRVVLTSVGRLALGLGGSEEDRAEKRRERAQRRARVTAAPGSAGAATGQGAQAPPERPPPEESADQHALGREWIKFIQGTL